MTPQIRHLISKKDRLLGENGAGVIIDEQVSYPGRPAQKKLLQPEKLSGDGRDIACTTQVVQGLAPSASTDSESCTKVHQSTKTKYPVLPW